MYHIFFSSRFTPEQRAKRDQYAYLPFGAGPRNCVGMRFALMEAKVCLAYVLSNFRFKTCRETKVHKFILIIRLLSLKYLLYVYMSNIELNLIIPELRT